MNEATRQVIERSIRQLEFDLGHAQEDLDKAHQVLARESGRVTDTTTRLAQLREDLARETAS